MKNQQKSKTFLLSVITVAVAGTLMAQQNFGWRANLPQPAADGFYRINLQPDFIARSQQSGADIRLADEQNTFQPWLFLNNASTETTDAFTPLPLTADSLQPGQQSTWTVENTTGKALSSLMLLLRNTAVQRTVNLVGSDNKTTWFAIKENVALETAVTDNNTSYRQTISFPASNYRYIKILLTENKKAPVNIEQAGLWSQVQNTPEYEALPVNSFTQKDSAGLSILTLHFPQAYQINKLHLTIAGTRFYQRPATIYQISQQKQQLVNEALITSTGGQDIITNAGTTQLVIHIHNGNNPPLHITSVGAFQQSRFLIAYLQQNKHYHLLTGNPEEVMPDYDLHFFRDSIRLQPPQLNHEAVTANPLYISKAGTSSNQLPSWLIWLCIGVAITALGMLSLKMVKEISKSKTQ